MTFFFFLNKEKNLHFYYSEGCGSLARRGTSLHHRLPLSFKHKFPPYGLFPGSVAQPHFKGPGREVGRCQLLQVRGAGKKLPLFSHKIKVLQYCYISHSFCSSFAPVSTSSTLWASAGLLTSPSPLPPPPPLRIPILLQTPLREDPSPFPPEHISILLLPTPLTRPPPRSNPLPLPLATASQPASGI